MQVAMQVATDVIQLTADGAKFALARAIPGAVWDRERRVWVLKDPTPRAAVIALQLFPELTYKHPELCELRDTLVQDIRPVDNATPHDTPVCVPEVERSLAEEGKHFYRFQSLDLGYVTEVLRRHGGAYLGWERGLGKTIGACSLIEAVSADRVLVICPNTAKESVWGDELRRRFPDAGVAVLPNEKRKRERRLREVQAYIRGRYHEGQPPRLILVVHYEALNIIAGKNGRGWDKYGEWDLVVADEAHRIKNPKAKMSRALKRIPTHMKLALSGSIIQNHAEELFSVLQWLFPDRYSSKWRDWNDRYLDYVDGGYGRVGIGVKLERLDEMREELGVFMVYRRKEDELDLPEKTTQELRVELTPSQRRVYEELQATCLSELADGTVVKAADGLVMLTRLRQVATGLDLLGKTVQDSSKLDLTQEIVTDAEDEAFVVFSWYRAAARSLRERLEAAGVEVFLVDGDVPHERRAEYIERFQAGERRVFIGTLATLSESVNLHRASNAIFLDRSWNPAQNIQAEDRIYRIGQTRPVTITHIVAADTVDERAVAPALSNKEALRALILGS